MGSNFYGGRDGQPFVIKQTFKTLEEMLLSSANIDYQEYALLSYDDHNHPLHGTLYRKNFDIDSFRTLNNYEYKDGKWDLLEVLPKAKGFYQVGNLKGSTGATGLINIVDMESYTDLLNNAKNDGMSVVEHIKPGESKGSISFVSPDDVDGKLQWCSFSKHSANNDYSEAVIGLQIPYYEFEVGETFPLEPHEVNETKTEVVVDESNPFKYTMNFKIPKGLNGSFYKDLQIIENDDGHFLACTYVNYSTEQAPTETRHIIGKYNMVESLSMEDGLFSISLTDGQAQTVSLKTIEEIKLEDGTFKVKYNYKDDFVEFGDLQNLILDTVTIDSDDTNLINPNLKVGGIAIVVEEV